MFYILLYNVIIEGWIGIVFGKVTKGNERKGGKNIVSPYIN